jgi:hypothetical protein
MDGIATAVPFAGDRGRGTDERIKARLIKRLELTQVEFDDEAMAEAMAEARWDDADEG